MALQSSGAISISDIKAELNNASNSLRDLSAAAGKSIPDAMSEFYGYASVATFSISGQSWEESQQACNEGPNSDSQTVYAPAGSSLSTGTVLYIDTDLQFTFDGQDFYFYSNGKYLYIGTDGRINDAGNC